VSHAAVTKHQRGRAKQLRQRMTRAENLLWRYLKAHHVDGLAFRRQVPMRQFIPDFVCHAARIVIEVDGASHDFASRQRADRLRDRWFESQGYAVLRFMDEQVLRNLEGVIEVIRRAAATRLLPAPPSLALPHKGGGNDAERAANKPTHRNVAMRVSPSRQLRKSAIGDLPLKGGGEGGGS
jgi:very-short-patch-repair endonuclease